MIRALWDIRYAAVIFLFMGWSVYLNITDPTDRIPMPYEKEMAILTWAGTAVMMIVLFFMLRKSRRMAKRLAESQAELMRMERDFNGRN